MKLALVTQRVEPDNAYGERRDALDQRWASMLQAAGFHAVSIPNSTTDDFPKLMERLSPDLIVLSGGNSIPVDGTVPEGAAPDRDALEAKLVDLAMSHGVPVAGICRGMQMLNVHFGGTLRRGEGHVATRHPLKGEGPEDVNSYHDYGILPPDLAPVLEAMAWAPDGSVEAIRHRSERIAGIMWHPEREGEFVSSDLAWLKGI